MSSSSQIYVIGAGGHGKVVVSCLQAASIIVAGIFDDDENKWGSSVLGVKVIGPIHEFFAVASGQAVIAVGNNGLRKKIAEEFYGVHWATAIHPQAYVHPTAVISPGAVIFAGAVIQPDTTIGVHAIINTGAMIDHDCVVGDFAHIAPGVHLAGGVTIGEGVLLGVGSCVSPAVTVGAWTLVGAGGAVIEDLSPNVVAVGVPARSIRRHAGQLKPY